jgi:hypothetical protein
MLLVARFWFEKFFLSTGMRVDGLLLLKMSLYQLKKYFFLRYNGTLAASRIVCPLLRQIKACVFNITPKTVSILAHMINDFTAIPYNTRIIFAKSK